MKYEWKQYIFKPEDFEGAGQYIVREHTNKLEYSQFLDTGYLSTVTQKVGYSNYSRSFKNSESSRYFLIDITDGAVQTGYYITSDKNGVQLEVKDWEFVEFSAKTSEEAKYKLCEYLNNNPHGETFRFLTHEELVRISLNQKWRTKEYG